jgi:hypothetical protein
MVIVAFAWNSIEKCSTRPGRILRNHAAGIASLDLFVVRTISFKLLYGLVILRHARRRLVSIRVDE